jgi:hypothetical protein
MVALDSDWSHVQFDNFLITLWRLLAFKPDGWGTVQVRAVVGRKPLCQGSSDCRRGTASSA